MVADCGCDYVLVYEPSLESSSEERFCSQYIQNTEVAYFSRTRSANLTFYLLGGFGHAFTLEFSAIRRFEVYMANSVYFDEA